MSQSKSLSNASVLASLLLLVFARNLYAYIDPGTGSYFLQLLMASLLGASFAIKLYWKRIKTFFANVMRKDNDKDKND
jgi:hypothetical protein